MKRILILTILAVCAQIVCGKTFEIKFLNTPSINIGGNELCVGKTFNEKAVIKWKSASQAMKVVSDDNRVYIVSQRLFAKYHAKSFVDYLTSVKAAAVRNGGENFPVSIDDHRAVFEDDFVLLDSLVFNVGWVVNKTSYFKATVNRPGGEKSSFAIPCKDRRLVITRDLLPDAAGDVSLTVRYVELKYNESTLITDSLNIEIVPFRTNDL